MEEFAYQFLINFTALFIIWCIWFGIAAKLHNKNQMIRATELTVGIFIARMFGLLGILIAFIIYFIIKKAAPKKDREPKRETHNEYIERLEKEKAEECKVEEVKHEVICTPPAHVEKVAHNIKPTKKVRSMKPLIIVTYILLIAAIIALTVFCVLSIQNKDNTISLLEADKAALQDDLKSTESKLKAKENELKTIKINLKNTQNNLTDTNKKLSYTLSSLTDARTDAAMWKEKYMQSDPANVTYSYEFPSVNALLMAIKKNPEAYNNKQVKVFGMILAYEHLSLNKKVIALIDYKNEALSNTDDFVARSLYRTKTEVKEAIEVTLSNDLQYIVAETGDYVNLYGTVRITTGGIFLDNSQYN